MAANLYGLGRNAFLNAGINWSSDTIMCVFVGSGYVANMTTDQYYSAVAASIIGAPMQLLTPTAVLGTAGAANITSGNLTSGSTITQIVIYKSTGTNATSPLIAREDVSPTIPTNGGTVTITWDPVNRIFTL